MAEWPILSLDKYQLYQESSLSANSLSFQAVELCILCTMAINFPEFLNYKYHITFEFCK